jgi:magnesium transporter
LSLKTQFVIKNIYDIIVILQKSVFDKPMSQSEVLLNSLKWVDYLDPSPQVLEQLAIELCLAKKIVLNCLDSDYLPHVETYGETHFIILRLMEPITTSDADSIQELTTKIALFVSPHQVVTVHRLPLPELDAVKEKIKTLDLEKCTKQKLVSLFLEQVSLGFDKPLTELEAKLEEFEVNFFHKTKAKNLLRESFYIKRKSSAFKKVLKLSMDLIAKLSTKLEGSVELYQTTKDRLERNLFYAEDVNENMQSLLNLHIAIESQKTNEASFKTNETMRVLTVLTIFFLPLNFVAGVFGMNFQHIPLLNHPYGFWISVAFMLFVSLFLAIYVIKQGWIRKPDLKTGEKL